MTEPNRRMFWHLSRAQRRLSAASDEQLADLELTTTQAGALLSIGEQGLLVGELAEALELAQSAASSLAKRLEEAGLVARTQEKGDGRAARLKLTAVGKRKRTEAARRAVAVNARMLEGFSEREIETVVRWLTHVAQLVESPPPADAGKKRASPAPATELVEISVEDGVMEIGWNRPEKKNALSNVMYRAATAALARAEKDKAIRVVLFSSRGEAFTAGNDLTDFASAAMGGEAPAANDFVEAIAQFEKPIVAAVPGLAVGVGTTMLLHCDLVFVASDAKLSTPFINLALVPEAASSRLLPARIGHTRAFAMFAFGEPLTGTEAAHLGLANAALPKGEVISAARAAARKLAQRPLGAVLAAKRLMRDRETIVGQLRAEASVFGERLRSAEAVEAFAAFRQKRAPDFSKF